MKINTVYLLIVVNILFNTAFGQEKSTDHKKRFIGTSAFVMANAIPNQTNPPGFYQLNLGYWITNKDVLSIEAITWKYSAPLGIPYGSSFENPDEEYPGYIREFGIGLAYQRYLWKRWYTSVSAIPFLQTYRNEEKEVIANGFQLFMTLRFGYHFEFFNDKFFLEPSIAFTHWPINTNVPASFADMENKWPNYFLFEPGLHCGIKF